MNLKNFALVAPLMLLVSATATAATPDGKPSDLVDVQSANCAQFEKAMSYAKPPAKPTKKQEAFAVLAQDDLVLAMTWVNGYLAGRDGLKGGAHAFTQDWIVTHMRKMTEICKANSGTMLLTDVAAKL
jgi:hypothetical protein